MLNRLWARVFPYTFLHAILNRDKTEAMKSHWKIFEGFAERDKKKIKDALREDLERAAAIIIPALEKSESSHSSGSK
jgi:DNA-binding GntR family transcriptional regulator